MSDLGYCAYYTPKVVAQVVAESIHVQKPRAVLDPAAGDGALLQTVVARFPRTEALAIDIDRSAVQRLRQILPDCTSSVCDALNGRSVAKSNVWRLRSCVDVVVANPPFGSLSGPRLADVVCWGGKKVRCGIGAAHILAALVNFLPKQLVAVLPDSMLHSERDGMARSLIASRYSLDVVQSLGSDAFGNAGASVSLVEMTLRRAIGGQFAMKSEVAGRALGAGPVYLIRGGLPMHDVKEVASGGIPLVHTNNLGDRRPFKLVRPLRRGVVSGPLVLLPRVGLPMERHLVATNLSGEHQLSDCVVAISCRSDGVASDVSKILMERFDALRACWGGTGAQYTTLAKLRDCLTKSGIAVDSGCVEASRRASVNERVANGTGDNRGAR